MEFEAELLEKFEAVPLVVSTLRDEFVLFVTLFDKFEKVVLTDTLILTDMLVVTFTIFNDLFIF